MSTIIELIKEHIISYIVNFEIFFFSFCFCCLLTWFIHENFSVNDATFFHFVFVRISFMVFVFRTLNQRLLAANFTIEFILVWIL